MKWVGMFSGGLASWMAAKRAAQKYGTKQGTLLFADVKGEDADTYRYLPQAASNVGVPLVTIAEGRTIWEVFMDERFLGNSRRDPCSRILKRELLGRWVAENCEPTTTVLIYGFDWSEAHRLRRMESYGDGWQREAPLLAPPYLTKADLIAASRAEGVEPPALYLLGFEHNNCGGGCVKAGQASFARLLRLLPARYQEWEEHEQQIRDHLGKDVSILTDRSGDGTKKPLTLRQFRERKQSGLEHNLEDYGACGCFQVTDGD